MIFQPDTVINDRYRILSLLGQGGFSQTYTVDDNGTQKVLKVLLENYPKAVHLFQREAKVLSRLDHPGIPKVDLDEYFTVPLEPGEEQGSEYGGQQGGDRLHCLVMELIPGVDLRRWLGDRQNQPITHDQALDWLQQIIDILAQIHQHHCFHRDIKPSNIMLRPNGQLALIDFGAVREVTETYLQKCEEDITRTHVYSRGYTPMEQMQGRAVPESDFFALGRTFVHLMTGINPLEFSVDANTGRLLWRSHAPSVSPALADLLDCLMAPFPGQRPHSPHDIRVALDEIQANPNIDSHTEGTVLSKLVPDPAQGDPVMPADAVNLLGTLPMEGIPMASEETQPPRDSLMGTTVGAESMQLSPDRPLDRPLVASAADDGVLSQSGQPLSRWRWLFRRGGRQMAGVPLIVACGLLTTGSAVGLRVAGLLQPVELHAFDALINARPAEEDDDRILLITVDEDDLTYQSTAGMVRQGSLADDALFQLLETITPHAPRVIGLDIYREVQPSRDGDAVGDRNLASQAYLEAYPNLVVVCAVGGGDSNYSAIPPPPTVPLEQVGFSDISLDGDNRVRRQIVGMDGADHCDTTVSLSYQLASRYLAQSSIDPSMTEEGVLRFGDRPFPPLENHAGGYHRGMLGGYELLLNYRQTDIIASTVSLREVLDGSLDAELENLVGDRIVLIGTTAPSFGDYHLTPSGEQAGVEIQAHMVSQLVSAALDDRPLLWAWVTWADTLWILAWAAASGSIAWFGRSPLIAWGGSGFLIIVSVAASYGMILIGGWMPMVPTLLAMGGSAVLLRCLKNK